MQQRYYFEQPDVSEEVLALKTMCHESLDDGENVDYAKPSYHRTWPIVLENKHVVYVNRTDIHRISPHLNKIISNQRIGRNIMAFGALSDISGFDFQILLSAICPTRFGLYSLPITNEKFALLYHFGRHYEIPSLIKRCHQFLLCSRLSTQPVDTLLKWYSIVSTDFPDGDSIIDVLRREMVLAVLLAIMNYPDYSTLVKTICFSNMPCMNLLKNVLKRRSQIYHRAEFVNGLTTGYNCCESSCRISPSFCGLICTSCSNIICSSCKNDVCSVALNDLLDSLGGRRSDASSPDSGYCDTVSGQQFSQNF
ncbi:unnamed protein product [Auanema sp. JU1783]|nr:unnamed protein product [Auanema sp. JU1783]